MPRRHPIQRSLDAVREFCRRLRDQRGRDQGNTKQTGARLKVRRGRLDRRTSRGDRSAFDKFAPVMRTRGLLRAKRSGRTFRRRSPQPGRFQTAMLCRRQPKGQQQKSRHAVEKRHAATTMMLMALVNFPMGEGRPAAGKSDRRTFGFTQGKTFPRARLRFALPMAAGPAARAKGFRGLTVQAFS